MVGLKDLKDFYRPAFHQLVSQIVFVSIQAAVQGATHFKIRVKLALTQLTPLKNKSCCMSLKKILNVGDEKIKIKQRHLQAAMTGYSG